MIGEATNQHKTTVNRYRRRAQTYREAKNSLNPKVLKLIALAVVFAVALLSAAAFAAHEIAALQKAHSTFGNYYAFRGCAGLLQRTADYGSCRLASGLVIKLDRSCGAWYLDGDLPVVCWRGLRL